MKKLFLTFLILSLTVNCFAVTELDYMEYASDAAAQAAYVTNGIDTYGSNVCTGGIAIKSSELVGNEASLVFNGVTTDYWQTTGNVPQWVGYDLGSGVTKVVQKYSLYGHTGLTAYNPKAWTFEGSNTGAWGGEQTTLNTQSLGGGISGWNSYTFSNSTGYRYYRLNISANGGETTVTLTEMEMYEVTGKTLQSYSESTIKTQGSYSLKGVATTGAINKTLTRTVSPTINLTDLTQIKYGIYSSRTGSNIKIGIHDSGGTTSEHTANIASAGGWETQTWDISGVSNANKDAIDSIVITAVNADAANTFYVDNAYAEAAARRIILIN